MSHPFDRVKITPLGRFFSFFTLLFGFAAINSGNNLLYLVLAYLLVLIFASGIFSTVNILWLEIEGAGQDELFKDSVGYLYLKLRKKKLPSFLLNVCLKDECTLITYIDKRERRIKLPLKPAKRGIHKLSEVYIYSLYPFGFAKRGINVRLKFEYFVYPRIDIPVDTVVDKYVVSQGEAYGAQRGYEGEFRGLKRYEIGEGLFHIHWRKSIKELNVKQFEGTKSRVYYLGISSEAEDGEIDKVASIAHRILDTGGSVGLVVDGNVVVPPGRGKEHERSILKVLALL